MTLKHPSLAALLLLTAAGALLFRVPELGNRPLHGDEAVHAAKFRELWQTGVYRYDANEFHGPTPYYAALPGVWLSGRQSYTDLREADLRLGVAVFGAAMVLLLLLLADALGRRATLWAALLTALSPAMVFYSRYFIQEMMLAFFTLALLGCGWRYLRKPGAGWAAATGVSAGLMVATKETAVITFAAVAAALALAAAWTRRADADPPLPPADDPSRTSSLPSRESGPTPNPSSPSMPGRVWGWKRGHLLLAAGVGLLTACLVLSGFLTNPIGPVDYLRSYTPWFGRAHGTDLHQHPWHYYLTLLAWTRGSRGPVWSEGLILALAVVGLAAAAVPKLSKSSGAEPGFLRFAALYTLLLTGAYSVIPYKTPWCLLSFLVGLLLLAGAGAALLISRARAGAAQAAVTLLLLAGCAQLGWQAYRTSFVYQADRRNPYVYAHTDPDVLRLQQQVEKLARSAPEGDKLVLKVFSVDAYYWPLPWYLRRFPNIGYWTSVPKDASAPVVIASPEFDEELTRQLDATHLMTGMYSLRPSVFLQLWVRLDLWEQYLKRYPPKPPD